MSRPTYSIAILDQRTSTCFSGAVDRSGECGLVWRVWVDGGCRGDGIGGRAEESKVEATGECVGVAARGGWRVAG